MRALDKVGSQPGELKNPWGIAVGADQKVYVCDRGNGRVQVFDENLHHIPKRAKSFPIRLEWHVMPALETCMQRTTVLTRCTSLTKTDSWYRPLEIQVLIQDLQDCVSRTSFFTLPNSRHVRCQCTLLMASMLCYGTSFGQDSPWSIAIDADGFVCVSDPGSSSVVVF